MSSRRIRPTVQGLERGLPLAIAVSVFVGLVTSALVNVWIEAPHDGALPGVALGSQTLLVVERAIAFFVAWLLVLVISVQAINGRLPIEISGRGLRYAEAERTQDSLVSTRDAIQRLDDETGQLRRRVATIEAESRGQHEC